VSRDRGSASLELVLLTPVLVALLLLVVTAGRYGQARSDVDAAARDAARSASLERSVPAARDAAEQAARRRLADRDVVCTGFDIMVSVDDFRAGGAVAATVRCDVRLDDLAGIGLPATMSFESTFAHPIDSFRGTDT
jgi:Flp pilus assembly protein TadG